RLGHTEERNPRRRRRKANGPAMAALGIPPPTPLPSREGAGARSAADVRHQAHEAGPLDRLRHGVLARSVATGLAAADDAAVAVGQLAQQIKILVVDEHRPGADAINANRVLLDDAAGG